MRILAGFFCAAGLGGVVVPLDFLETFLTGFLADDVAFLGDERLRGAAEFPRNPNRSGIPPADVAERLPLGVSPKPIKSERLPDDTPSLAKPMPRTSYYPFEVCSSPKTEFESYCCVALSYAIAPAIIPLRPNKS